MLLFDAFVDLSVSHVLEGMSPTVAVEAALKALEALTGA